MGLWDGLAAWGNIGQGQTQALAQGYKDQQDLMRYQQTQAIQQAQQQYQNENTDYDMQLKGKGLQALPGGAPPDAMFTGDRSPGGLPQPATDAVRGTPGAGPSITVPVVPAGMQASVTQEDITSGRPTAPTQPKNVYLQSIKNAVEAYQAAGINPYLPDGTLHPAVRKEAFGLAEKQLGIEAALQRLQPVDTSKKITAINPTTPPKVSSPKDAKNQEVKQLQDTIKPRLTQMGLNGRLGGAGDDPIIASAQKRLNELQGLAVSAPPQQIISGAAQPLPDVSDKNAYNQWISKHGQPDTAANRDFFNKSYKGK